MSLVLCACGTIQNNRIRQSETCAACGQSNWVNADSIDLEAVYWKQRYNALAAVVTKQGDMPNADDAFYTWLESTIEKELWSGNYNQATRDEFIAHRVWLHYKDNLNISNTALEFYANTENWSRRDTLFWESIDRSDCADYPHLTRDLKLTGGKRARKALETIKGIK